VTALLVVALQVAAAVAMANAQSDDIRRIPSAVFERDSVEADCSGREKMILQLLERVAGA